MKKIFSVEYEGKAIVDQGVMARAINLYMERWPFDLQNLKVKELPQEQETKNDLCRCGHTRKYHTEIKSHNYTQGKCGECKCQHFIIKSQTTIELLDSWYTINTLPVIVDKINEIIRKVNQ